MTYDCFKNLSKSEKSSRSCTIEAYFAQQHALLGDLQKLRFPYYNVQRARSHYNVLPLAVDVESRQWCNMAHHRKKRLLNLLTAMKVERNFGTIPEGI